MKTILALAAALVMGTTAYAQESPLDSSTGSRHMFEFSADSVLQGILSFDKSKTRGADADNDTQLDLDINYAYSLITMPRLQLGGRVTYNKGTQAGRGDLEDYGLEVGAIVNAMADLENSAYASLYLGMGWANTYGNNDFGRKDEVLTSTLAVGKRFSMDMWGIKHLTYTPEIALENINSTTSSNLEYSQNIQFRFLQFAVFF
ncbi:MAG: hypothetical protein NDI69_11955 [Bacteriovoracaceae bacterium]|nr:hypothetical protein [Bacteriovoracaceae bacterium]